MYVCMYVCVMSIPDYGSAVMHNFCVYVCVFFFVCVCLFPLCFCHSPQSEERKGKESKGKERDGMRSSVFSILYVLLGTCLCNVLVQIMKEVFNHHSTPHYTPEPGNADSVDNNNNLLIIILLLLAMNDVYV